MKKGKKTEKTDCSLPIRIDRHVIALSFKYNELNDETHCVSSLNKHFLLRRDYPMLPGFTFFQTLTLVNSKPS